MTTPRPLQIIKEKSRRFPGAWKLIDDTRAWLRGTAIGNDGKVILPDWCFLPSVMMSTPLVEKMEQAGINTKEFFERQDNNEMLIERTAAVVNLGAWRLTQGIYRFDPTVFVDLIDTSITGDIPIEVLLRFPEWSLYVETPGFVTSDGQEVYGCFVSLDAAPRGPESAIGEEYSALLNMQFDTTNGLLSSVVEIMPWEKLDPIHVFRSTTPLVENLVSKMLNLVLYICGQASEVGTGQHRPKKLTPRKTKKGVRSFPADRPTVWPVGERMGAALRQAYAYEAAHSKSGDSGHAGMRPHIRRAHWHGYWKGPREGKRAFELKWLPPTAVKVDGIEGLATTVRTVE